MLQSLEKIAKEVQNGGVSRVTYKLYHHGLIAIVVKKELEAKEITWEVFLKYFQKISAGELAGTSASKKRKVETSCLTKTKRKNKRVQVEEKSVEETPSSAKIRVTRTLNKKMTISLGTSRARSRSLILIDESPQASLGD